MRCAWPTCSSARPADDVDWEGVGLEGCCAVPPPALAPGRPGLRRGARGDRRRRGRGRPGRAPAHRADHRRVRALVVQHRGRRLHGVRQPAATSEGATDFAVDTLLLLLAPAAPHITAELWERRHPGEHVHAAALAGGRPGAGHGRLGHDGRPGQRQGEGPARGRPRLSEAEAEALALADAHVVAALGGAAPRQVIARPPKIVNVVV